MLEAIDPDPPPLTPPVPDNEHILASNEDVVGLTSQQTLWIAVFENKGNWISSNTVQMIMVHSQHANIEARKS